MNFTIASFLFWISFKSFSKISPFIFSSMAIFFILISILSMGHKEKNRYKGIYNIVFLSILGLIINFIYLPFTFFLNNTIKTTSVFYVIFSILTIVYLAFRHEKTSFKNFLKNFLTYIKEFKTKKLSSSFVRYSLAELGIFILVTLSIYIFI